MLVYVVETGVYSERGIAGIYSSVEKAMEAHPAPGEPNGPPLHAIAGKQTDPSKDMMRDGGWQKETAGGWHNGFDMGWSASIYAYELDGGLPGAP